MNLVTGTVRRRHQLEPTTAEYNNNSQPLSSSTSNLTQQSRVQGGLDLTKDPLYCDIIAMTCRDRTQEFVSTLKSLQSRQTTNGYMRLPNPKEPRRTEFNIAAKKVGKDLANTFAKLEKLTILAKRKSIFDDKPVEIQELTYIIKQDINGLNKQISQLQDLAKARSNAASKHMQTHSTSVVVSLQSKLAHMSNDFKHVLEVRTENLKEQKLRRDQFSQGPIQSSLPPSATDSASGGSVLLLDESNDMAGAVSIDMDPLRQRNQMQQQQLIDEQDDYIKDRASTMQSIESTIVELGGIFQQLAHMIHQQEEQVQRIDAHTDEIEMNVEAAHSEILKYFQSVTSNRWLMIKIFGVLIIFFIVFIIFVA